MFCGRMGACGDHGFKENVVRGRGESGNHCVSMKRRTSLLRLQGYLAHKKTPTPLGPPYDTGNRPTVGF